MRKWCGCEVETGWGAPECADVFSAKVGGPARFDGRDLSVPGDISSAAFLLAAAALLPGSDLTIEGVGLNPTRAEIIPTLRWLGAEDRKSTRLNSSHANISYAVFCSKKKNAHK